MATLDNDGHAVLINTFTVAPARAGELLTVLHEASAAMRRMPGFVSANLHLSDDATRVVNYVQWRKSIEGQVDLASPLIKSNIMDRCSPAGGTAQQIPWLDVGAYVTRGACPF